MQTSQPFPDALRLRCGVSGHRILAETERISAGITEALRQVHATYPGRRLVVLSSLAEGADRLVAQQALREPGAQLIALLPLPMEDYRMDFATPASQSEFEQLLAQAAETIVMPSATPRNAAYKASGQYIADRCDVMLVVWDGQPAQGRGGTAEIVAYTRQQGKPLVIVRAGNRKPNSNEPTSLGAEQGRVVTERLPTVGSDAL